MSMFILLANLCNMTNLILPNITLKLERGYASWG
ncbi:MAG: hypothetical protein MHPDNHAH_00379 [Anaerolineales bacterium]|nr:hypothetical protein [Anaerolineales bacterium]